MNLGGLQADLHGGVWGEGGAPKVKTKEIASVGAKSNGESCLWKLVRQTGQFFLVHYKQHRTICVTMALTTHQR